LASAETPIARPTAESKDRDQMRQALVLVRPQSDDGVFLDLLLENIARFGLREAIILIDAAGPPLESRYASHPVRSMNVRVVRASEPGGTGVALQTIAPDLDALCLVIDGGTWFDVNLLALKQGLDPGDAAIVAVRRAPTRAQTPGVDFAAGRVSAFTAVPNQSTAPVHISGGVALVRSAAWAHVSEPFTSIEFDVLTSLAARGQLAGMAFDRPFLQLCDADAAATARRIAHRPVVFFDRDGCLNHDAGYTHKVEDLRWIDGAKEAIRLVNDAGWLAIVATNQGGIGKGLYDEAAMLRFHAAMQHDLAASGAHIDAFYFNPYHPAAVIEALRQGNHPDRKPNPGMLLRAARDWSIDMAASLMIGDQDSDVATAVAVGITGIKYAGGRLDAYLERLLAPHRPRLQDVGNG
jgi:D,D-heptose 1,7-bisphosphate phosphatase